VERGWGEILPLEENNNNSFTNRRDTFGTFSYINCMFISWAKEEFGRTFSRYSEVGDVNALGFGENPKLQQIIQLSYFEQNTKQVRRYQMARATKRLSRICNYFELIKHTDTKPKPSNVLQKQNMY